MDGAERVSKGKAGSGTPGPEGSRRPYMDTLTLYLGYFTVLFSVIALQSCGLEQRVTDLDVKGSLWLVCGEQT